MKPAQRLFLFVAMLAAPALGGCSSRPELQPDDYRRFFDSEACVARQRKQIGKLSYELTFNTPELMALRELGAAATPEACAETARQFEGMVYFTLRLRVEGYNGELLRYAATGPEDYQQRVIYATQDMQKDFTLVAGRDTIPCALYHLERTFGLTPYQTVLLGFDYPAEKARAAENGLQVIYRDNLMGSGTVKLRLDTRKLDELPLLSFAPQL